jgi:redox-sensitive bicupin YhaK (pirin superfamily)
MVGAWCFLDAYGPHELAGSPGMRVGPHPHIGLQTVTWLLAGEVVHRDSLGSDQLIRPGQLNLMTAGRGVAHAEQTPASYRGEIHLVQLWVAQPDATRFAAPAFEHHGELPHLELDNATATVLIGDFGGATSPARRDTDHFGADLALRAGSTTLPLRPDCEHALLVLEGDIAIGAKRIGPDELAYIGTGRDALEIVTSAPARMLLLGGMPFEARPFMWWNFVARSRDEVDDAVRDWNGGDDRFGRVDSPLARIDSPAPPWTSNRS